jgi:hypothetical protein
MNSQFGHVHADNQKMQKTLTQSIGSTKSGLPCSAEPGGTEDTLKVGQRVVTEVPVGTWEGGMAIEDMIDRGGTLGRVVCLDIHICTMACGRPSGKTGLLYIH